MYYNLIPFGVSVTVGFETGTEKIPKNRIEDPLN